MKIASAEVRALVINGLKEKRFTPAEAARFSGYSLATVSKWLREEAYEPRPRGHRAASFSQEELEELRVFMEQNPGATLEDIREAFGKTCTLSSVHRNLKKLGLSTSKSRKR